MSAPKPSEKEPDDPSMRAVITLAKSLGQVTSQLEAMRKENQSLRLKLRKANDELAKRQDETHNAEERLTPTGE
jgi:regulator of replication initiation timing